MASSSKKKSHHQNASAHSHFSVTLKYELLAVQKKQQDVKQKQTTT
jgi:hypothetical protein